MIEETPEWRQQVNQTLAAHQQAIETQRAHLGQVSQELLDLIARVERLDTRLEALEARVAHESALSGDMSEVDDELLARVSRLEARLAEVGESLVRHQDRPHG